VTVNPGNALGDRRALHFYAARTSAIAMTCAMPQNETPRNPEPKRPRYGERPHKPGLYLGLFHGRDRPDARMDDWGYNGPAIGPLRWCHTTYTSTIRIEFETHADALLYFGEGFDGEVPLHDDMLMYDGNYYGDWTVYYVSSEDCTHPNDTFRPTARRVELRAHR